MKKFEVPVKSTLFDFTHTKNIWLTVHPTMQDLVTDKRDCAESLLFSLDEPIDLASRVSTKILNSYYRKNNNPSQNLIFYDQARSQIQIHQNENYCFYYYHYKKSKMKLIDNLETRLHVSPGDRLLILNQPAEAPVLVSILKNLAHPSYFSFPLLSTVNEKFQQNASDTQVLALIDFSPNESYGFKLKSSLSTVSLTIEMIKNKVLKYDYNKIWKIETVLHEALVNAITYGNELNPDFVVDIHYEIGSSGFRIWIRDEGEGFDINNISVPVGVDALDRISGRGIYMMKKFSDSLFFNEDGNEVMLFFEFNDSKTSDSSQGE